MSVPDFQPELNQNSKTIKNLSCWNLPFTAPKYELLYYHVAL